LNPLYTVVPDQCVHISELSNSFIILTKEPIYQCVISSLILEYGTDKLSRNVGKIIATPRCVIAQKDAVLIYQLFSIAMKTEATLQSSQIYKAIIYFNPILTRISLR